VEVIKLYESVGKVATVGEGVKVKAIALNTYHLNDTEAEPPEEVYLRVLHDLQRSVDGFTSRIERALHLNDGAMNVFLLLDARATFKFHGT
jgi:hypothetical protein